MGLKGKNFFFVDIPHFEFFLGFFFGFLDLSDPRTDFFPVFNRAKPVFAPYQDPREGLLPDFGIFDPFWTVFGHFWSKNRFLYLFFVNFNSRTVSYVSKLPEMALKLI